MPIAGAEGNPKRRGATLSNHEVSQVVKKMKTPDTKTSPKLKRRNSQGALPKHGSSTPNIPGGLLTPRSKKPSKRNSDTPFPGIPHHTLEKEKVESPNVRKKKVKLKSKQFSGLFTLRRSSTNSSSGSSTPKSPRKEKKKKIKLDNYDVSSVVRIQSFWRMIYARKVRNAFSSHTNLKMVRQLLQAMHFSEGLYINTLQTLKNHYFIPLTPPLKKGTPQSIISLAEGCDIQKLFPNINEAIVSHSDFAQKLESCLKNWPFTDFTRILKEHSAELIRLYRSFPNTKTNAIDLVYKLLRNPTFQEFMSTASKKHPDALQNQTIRDFVNAPLNYIYQFEDPCKSILNSIEPDSYICNRMQKITLQTNLFASYLQDSFEKIDCQETINLLKTIQGHVELPDTHRRSFVRDRAAKVNSKRSRLFLFSDVLYLAQYRPKQKVLKYANCFPLSQLTVTKLRKSTKKNSIDFLYTIETNNEKIPTLKCRESSSSGISGTLVYLLEEYIKRCRDFVFGVPLSKAMPEPQNLPLIFRKIIYHIDRIPDKKYLFHKTGNPTAIVQLRINEARSDSNDMGSAHRDDIAGLLILYLEMLPECILPFHELKSLPNLDKDLIKPLTTIIENLPAEKKNILEYLTYFLARLVNNNVNIDDIAYTFTPLIIKCKELDVDYCRKVDSLFHVITVLILNRDKIFHPSSKKVSLPKDIKEFIKADPFGDWWKLFRENNEQLINFLVNENSIKQFVDLIINPSKEIDYADTISNILTTEYIMKKLVNNPLLLDELFGVTDKKDITEERMRWITAVWTKLVYFEPIKLSNYLTKHNQSYNEKIVKRLGSGSVSSFMDEIVKQDKVKELFDLLSSWCILAFDQSLKSKYSLTDDTLCNSVQFVCTVIQEESFQNSETFSKFQNHLSLSKLKELVTIALDKSNPLTACEIHRIISSLIALKELSVSVTSGPTIQTEEEQSESINTNVVNDSWIAEESGDEESESEESESEDDSGEELTATTTEKSTSQRNSRVLDIPSEATMMSSDEEDLPVNRSRLRLSSSFLRWSGCVGPVLNNAANVERTNMLSLFLSERDAISKILNDRNGENNIKFGMFRLGVLHIVQITVLAANDAIIDKITKSTLLKDCVKVFFDFPNHNIMHHVVQEMITVILQRNNDTLVHHFLNETDIVKNTIALLNEPEEKWVNIGGHLKLIIKAVNNNAFASALMKSKKEWQAISKKME